MHRLDKQHPMPVYLQLKEMLQNQIERGIYRSHQKLPSERDLCQNFNLSRMTARRALRELIDEGLAYTRVGKGTFVSYKTGQPTRKSPESKKQLPDLDAAEIITAHYQQKLIDRLLCFNALGVERVISDIMAAYPLETVAVRLFPAIIRQFEQLWQRGEISLLAHNYGITTLRTQLIAMVSATPPLETGPKVVLACAPGDHHEIGVLLLTFSLRRRGFQTIYLGPDITAADFKQVTDVVQPQLICLSAATSTAGQALAVLSQEYQDFLLSSSQNHHQGGAEKRFTFGGVAFTQDPGLKSHVSGLYLGDTIEAAVTKIQTLLSF